MMALLSSPSVNGAGLTAAAKSNRWLEVVSHLDPKYGGLSSTVPALGCQIANDVSFDVKMAAFCAPHEQYRPSGYDESNLSFWPASRKVWIQDRLRERSMQQAFRAELLDRDGIHIHGLWEQSTAIAASLARSLGKPYIISAHGMLEPWALAQKRLKKAIYGKLIERPNVSRATCLHALTQAEAQQFRQFSGNAPIAVIPNGVDIPQDVSPEPFLQAYPALRGKRVILFLGRLHPKKGLTLLLEAWFALARDFPQAQLVLAGPDSESTRATLESRIAAGALQESVLLPGLLLGELKWSALAAAEALVLPSFSEGLSVGVLEAMGMGLPVVVTEQCNMPEVVTCKAGWQIQPNVEELTQALGELLTNHSSVNRTIGRRAANLIQTRYTWPIVARQMSELYTWVSGSASTRPSFLLL